MSKRLIPFIFVSASADSSVRTKIETDTAIVVTVGVKNYAEAGELARELVAEGAVAVELCSGFGPIGVARVVEAIGNKVPVGVIRFDKHPGLGQESGDVNFC